MPNIRKGRRVQQCRDERGVALLAAIAVTIVVVLLSTAAIEQSVNSLTQSAIANQQVSSIDAAEAGVQAEFKQITSQAYVAGGTFTCPPTTPSASGNTALVGPGAFGANYTMSYATVTAGVQSPYTPCTTQQTVPLAAGTTYLIKAAGNTAATTTGSKTLVAQVYVPTGLVGTPSTLFPEALFAGDDVTDNPSSFAVKPATSGTPTSADTYSGYVGQCGTRAYGGNYYDLYDNVPPATLPSGSATTFTGTCSVAGNLIMYNPPTNLTGVTLTGGTGVGGNIYTNGPVSITAAGVNVGTNAGGGGIYASGAVNICPPSGAVTVHGPITNGDAVNGLSFCPSGTTNVAADINSAGPIDGGSPSVAGVLNDYGSFGTYANGLINLTNSYISGLLYGDLSINLTSTTVGSAVIGGGNLTLNNVTAPSIQSQGAITLTGGTYGSVYAVKGVTIEGGATVTGTIYSSGGVNLLSGTVGTIEDENGAVSCNSNKTSGTLSYYNATVSGCVAGPHGPTAVKSYSAPFSSTSVPVTTPLTPPDDYPTSAYMGICGCGAMAPSPAADQNNTTNAINAATTAAANTINGGASSPALCSGEDLPCVNFPALNYVQNNWLSNTSFCGRAVACTPSNMNLVTNNDCTGDSASILAYVEGLERSGALPTVIQTNCQFSPGLAGLSGLTLYNNLAIFDTAGFSFAPSFTAGISSGDGATHQFFAIVPSTPNTEWSATGVATVVPYGYGSVTCGLSGTWVDSGPDIVVDAPLTDSHIEDFLYTPGSVCNQSGTGTILGKVYAGQEVDGAPPSVSPTPTWAQTFFNISPAVATAGSAAQLGVPTISFVTRASS
jgi:Tfp pilus assembly protein PilX